MKIFGNIIALFAFFQHLQTVATRGQVPNPNPSRALESYVNQSCPIEYNSDRSVAIVGQPGSRLELNPGALTTQAAFEAIRPSDFDTINVVIDIDQVLQNPVPQDLVPGFITANAIPQNFTLVVGHYSMTHPLSEAQLQAGERLAQQISANPNNTVAIVDANYRPLEIALPPQLESAVPEEPNAQQPTRSAQFSPGLLSTSAYMAIAFLFRKYLTLENAEHSDPAFPRSDRVEELGSETPLAPETRTETGDIDLVSALHEIGDLSKALASSVAGATVARAAATASSPSAAASSTATVPPTTLAAAPTIPATAAEATEDQIKTKREELKRLRLDLYGLTVEFEKNTNRKLAEIEAALNDGLTPKTSYARAAASTTPTELKLINGAMFKKIKDDLEAVKTDLENPSNHYFFAKAVAEAPKDLDAVEFVNKRLADPNYRGTKEPLRSYLAGARAFQDEKKLIKQQDAIIASPTTTEEQKATAKAIRRGAVSAIEKLKSQSENSERWAPSKLIERGGDFDDEILDKDSEAYKTLMDEKPTDASGEIKATASIDSDAKGPSYVFAAKVLPTQVIVSTKVYSPEIEPVTARLLRDGATGRLDMKISPDDWKKLNVVDRTDLALNAATKYLYDHDGQTLKTIRVPGTDPEQVACLHAAVLHLIMQNPAKFKDVDVYSVCKPPGEKTAAITRIEWSWTNPYAKTNFIAQHLGIIRKDSRDIAEKLKFIKAQGKDKAAPIDIRDPKGPKSP